MSFGWLLAVYQLRARSNIAPEEKITRIPLFLLLIPDGVQPLMITRNRGGSPNSPSKLQPVLVLIL